MAGYNAQQEFIDNYRNAQAEKTAQIGEQAHALGSDLTAQYGGLHGPSEYWLSRYQTPQTESRLAGLRAANQAQALNQLMKNDLEREAEKYNQAYRNYQKRARSYGSGYGSGSGGGGNSGDGGSSETLDISTVRSGDTSDTTVSLNPNAGVAGKVDYDPSTGATFVTNEDGTKTELKNLSDAAEMRAQGWKLTQTFPGGTPMIDGAVYTDPQTGFTYKIVNGRMYQIDTV